jgi:hypothetical protein
LLERAGWIGAVTEQAASNTVRPDGKADVEGSCWLAVTAACLPPNLMQTAVYFLPIFYRPAKTEYARALSKMGKVLIHVALVLLRLCSLRSEPAF